MMGFEKWYATRYEGNDPAFKMHLESAWNAAINSAADAVENADHSDDDSGHGANCHAMIAVEELIAR